MNTGFMIITNNPLVKEKLGEDYHVEYDKSVMLSETPEGLDAQAMQIIASAIQACGKFQFKSDLYKPQVYADFQLVDYTLISSALPSAESWR